MANLNSSMADRLKRLGRPQPEPSQFDFMPESGPVKLWTEPIPWFWVPVFFGMGLYALIYIPSLWLKPIPSYVPPEASLSYVSGHFANYLYYFRIGRNSTAPAYVFNTDAGKQLFLTCQPGFIGAQCIADAEIGLADLSKYDVKVGYYYFKNDQHPNVSNVLASVQGAGKTLIKYDDRKYYIQRNAATRERFYHSPMGILLVIFFTLFLSGMPFLMGGMFIWFNFIGIYRNRAKMAAREHCAADS